MLKKFTKYYKPHMKLFFLDLVAALFMSSVDLVFPIFSKIFINDYIPNGKIDLLLKTSIFILLLYLLRMGAQFFMSYWGHIVGARMEYDMRNELYKHLHTLPFKYFDDNKTGQIMSRLTGDLREVAELAHHGPEDIFISSVMLIGSFFILLALDVQLTLIIFFFVALLLLYALLLRDKMAKASKNVMNKHANINAKVENSISGIRLAKAFANEGYEIDKFDIINRQHLDSRNGFYMAMSIFGTGTNFLTDIIGVVVIVVGGLFVYKGQISMGDLVAYLLYSSYFIKPIRRLIEFTQQYQAGMAGFSRYLELLETKSDIVDSADSIEIDQNIGNINIENVSFSYSNNDDYVLRNFNLNIQKGTRIALVGSSGVGKTTITQLIPRFYDIENGSIKIDGVNIKNIKLQSLRKQIGIVQQDVFLFYGSIRDNILYGNPEASENEIITASKNANIHDFIESLPDGYDTLVGERGIKLSGGQKQRLAIARVFLKNPPILILDEATSALDSENEIAIQDSLKRLSKGRTTITIAHRLTTVIESDEIVVINGNGIEERGSHENLIKKNGTYSMLFKAQFRGFIPEEVF